MSWEAIFNKGVAYSECGDLEQALVHMNWAAQLKSDMFIVYDSRAVIHEKLGHLNAALLDSNRALHLAPDLWQCYARSARLFNLLGRHGPAIEMVDRALSLLQPVDVQQRTQLTEIRERVVVAQAADKEQRSSQAPRTSYLLGGLPVETLAEIFMLLVDEDHTFAVGLSHICGHWRRILLNTPSAWKTLVLSKKHPVRKAKLWKQRAKNRIVHLSIDVLQLDRDSVFAALRNLSWHCLSSLRISEEALVELYLMLCDLSIPQVVSNLDQLTLNCWSYDPLSCCRSGPSWKLTSLHLNGSIHAGDEWWKRIRQLKELHIHGTFHRLSMGLFRANPSLEKLVIDCPEGVNHIVNDVDTVTSMNSLKSIELRNTSNLFFDVVRGITTPSIMHFSMSSINTMADETLLLVASCPSLVELHISNCNLDPFTLPALLSSIPNLQTLRINGVHAVVNELLRFLHLKTVDPPHALLCPVLKHVDVSFCTDLRPSSVFMFVKTRAHYASESVEPAMKCAIISSLKVDGCLNIEPKMLPWFRSRIAQFSCVHVLKEDTKDL